MQTVLEDNHHPSHLTSPFMKDHSIWAHECVPHDTSARNLSGPHHSSPGLAVPNADQLFTLADWA